jgi:hypothetical protein
LPPQGAWPFLTGKRPAAKLRHFKNPPKILGLSKNDVTCKIEATTATIMISFIVSALRTSALVSNNFKFFYPAVIRLSILFEYAIWYHLRRFIKTTLECNSIPPSFQPKSPLRVPGSKYKSVDTCEGK